MTTNGKPQATPAPFHPPGRMPSLSSAVDAAQVMLRYQDLMERFLESQHSLMSAYLSGYDGPDPGLLLPLTKIEESNGHHPTPIVGTGHPLPGRYARPRPGRRVRGPGRIPPRPRPRGTTVTG